MGKQAGITRGSASVSYQDPVRSAEAVTKSDSTTYDGARALYVGTAGDLAVLLAGDTVPVTLVGVPAGTFLAMEVTKVMSAGTSASNIVIFY